MRKPASISTLENTTTDEDPIYEETAQALEHWLADQTSDGVSELVLIGLLQGYADKLQRRGYIPRS